MGKIKKKIILLLRIKFLKLAGPDYEKESALVSVKFSPRDEKVKRFMSDKKIEKAEQKHRNTIESLKKKYREV